MKGWEGCEETEIFLFSYICKLINSAFMVVQHFN